MINEDPNMGRKQIFSELPLPSKVEEKGILTLIYKGVFIVVKLLLDIRLNLVKISEGKPIKTKHKEFQSRSQKPTIEKLVDNPVIKNTDNIKVEDNGTGSPIQPDTLTQSSKDVPSSREKPDQIKLTEGKTKTNTKESKDTESPIESPDGQQSEETKDQKDNVDPQNLLNDL